MTLALSHWTIASAYYPYGTCVGSCDAGTCPGGGQALYNYWVPSYPADVVWCP